MNDLVTSTIRTMVPSFVGLLVLFLARNGITLDDAAIAGLTAFIGSLAIGAYYLAARALEQKWPALGVLLGSTKQPTYTEKK